MKEVTEEDKKEIIRLCNLTRAAGGDKTSLVKMIQKYSYPGFNMCFTCAAQVRSGFQRLKEFAKKEGIWSDGNQI